jgi:adenine-specific DNA-methyltransferase
MNKQAPALTWPGRDAPPCPVTSALLEEPALSYPPGRAGPRTNRLIQGDNLPALATLAGELAGQVQCVYIDPPYNTGCTFPGYDDAAAQGDWLSMMAARLPLLRDLLCPGGFLFVQIDARQLAYLKVLLDELFGRRCWVNDIVWKRRGGSANPTNRLNNVTDFILWYARTEHSTIQPVYSRQDDNTLAYIAERFTRTIDGRRYMLAPVERNAALGVRETLRFEYKGYRPRYGWMMSRAKLQRLDDAGRLHWNGRGRPNRRVFLDDYRGQPVGNLWTDIKVINPMAQERLAFDGQKPEALVQRVLQLSTRPGDLVLDAFAGSGTTGAAAHKMGRRWALIEQGSHCRTLIAPRLARVIDGTDPGGITADTGWQGGGHFSFFSAGDGRTTPSGPL